ncbi:putative membrane protein [Anaplasma phagocytophilum]|uniref:Putative membrane protein n=1 Tax=Anaplasma phagocytophilum str. NCH-1 TaxID=1359161 RepID=A0A0F3NJP1_ANAPH|nr:putative membrane protein [Anaplasma phagocytophilum str. NCH-1]KKA00008.1 putative membrane protein [Anaplasma phagocytophilum]
MRVVSTIALLGMVFMMIFRLNYSVNLKSNKENNLLSP